MLKRLLLAAGIIAGLLTPAYPAGTISLSLSQQFDSLGKPLNGGRLYFFQAGTTTPQSAYQDSGLTIPHPNPIVLDSAGRVPQFFLADGSIKIRLDTAAGVTQIAADGILVIGASSGGGGGSPVDATTVLATGDLKPRYGTGALSGFVRANGRTIGSATSGATERANADTQALFQYLWDADANLAVSGGRGASAAADWAANKTIVLPDWSGRALAFLDDMGAGPRGRLTTSYFGTNPTVLGAASTFMQYRTLSENDLPVISKAATRTQDVALSVNYRSVLQYNNSIAAVSAITNIYNSTDPGQNASFTPTGWTQPNFSFSFGGGGSFSIIPPTLLATMYIKL